MTKLFADYIAVSYTRDEFLFGIDKVFNWDGHNPFWPGRTVNNPDNLCYDNVSFTNIYSNTTLFNAAMFDIWDQLGKQYTDKLFIEALHGFYQNMSFRDAAMLIIDADSMLAGSANDWLIWQAFDKQCILDWSDVTERTQTPKQKPYILRNSLVSGSKAFQIELLDGFATSMITVYDITGKLIHSQNLQSGVNDVVLTNAQSGVYVVRLQIGEKTFAEKIVLNK